MAENNPQSVQENKPQSIREQVFRNLKVEIRYGDELRDGISKCLEQALGVSRDTLSNQLQTDFDIEVKQMHAYLPARMKKFARNKFVVIKKSSVFFSKTIELVETPEVANDDAPEPPKEDEVEEDLPILPPGVGTSKPLTKKTSTSSTAKANPQAEAPDASNVEVANPQANVGYTIYYIS